MKVLFLDIDGVLNSETTQERLNIERFYKLCGVDGVLRDRFLNWTHSHNVSVVLSSMWRNYPEMMQELNRNGITWDDVTPRHPNYTDRGDEIRAWLQENPCSHYAILDDNDWFDDDQKEHFVQTDYLVGLQDSDLERLDTILGF